MPGKREWFFLMSALVFVLLFFLFRIPVHGLLAHYYRNTEWKGETFLKKVETRVNLETFEDIMTYSRFPQTNISISWRGWIWIEHEGVYQFSTRSDDGSSIMIDGELIVDNGGLHGIREVAGEVFLSKGMHAITINYFNGPASYTFTASWVPPQGIRSEIPSTLLFPSHFSRYLEFLPRHPLLVYLLYPALWIVLFAVSLGAKLKKSLLQYRKEVIVAVILILLCCLAIHLRYVCDPDERLRTFIFFSYGFFLSAPCFYVVFRLVFPEVIGRFFFIFYLFLALFPYKIFFPSSFDLCRIYTDPSTTLFWGLNRSWVIVLYGILSLILTLVWGWFSKHSLIGKTSKKELVICGMLLLVVLVQIGPRIDRNSPRLVGEGMHHGDLPCDDDLTGKCVKEFWGHCVMCDVRHHTDANGIFKGFDHTYHKWVNNRRGLNAYLYALVEPFLHPYWAALFINGFFFYLILLAGYTLARHFRFNDTIALVCPILFSANYLLLHDTVDTSFYVQKHAFPIFLLVAGYVLRIFSDSASWTHKLLFGSILACSALVYTPFINVAFIFFWGGLHALEQIKISRQKTFSFLLHAGIYALIPLLSLRGFEMLLRHYHLEGYLDNANVRNVILEKLLIIPSYLLHNTGEFIARCNREIFQLFFRNPVLNEYFALLGVLGVICFFSLLVRAIPRHERQGVYAIYSACLIVPFIAALAAYIPPVAQYAPAYTAPDRVSNYYILFILAQSMGITYIAKQMCRWLPEWIRPEYLIFLMVSCIFAFSYYRILFT